MQGTQNKQKKILKKNTIGRLIFLQFQNLLEKVVTKQCDTAIKTACRPMQ